MSWGVTRAPFCRERSEKSFSGVGRDKVRAWRADWRVVDTVGGGLALEELVDGMALLVMPRGGETLLERGMVVVIVVVEGNGGREVGDR